jgi:hypothetical protein
MDRNDLKALSKNDIPNLANRLDKADIRFLIQTLEEKEDTIRYHAFLLLQENSRQFPFTYEYWSTLEEKLYNQNSYQRSLGLMLLAENVRWDKQNRFDETINKYLSCCVDEKFITARQAIQGLAKILKTTDRYDDKIKQSLAFLSLAKYKENQQRLLSKDIATILKIVENKKKQPK